MQFHMEVTAELAFVHSRGNYPCNIPGKTILAECGMHFEKCLAATTTTQAAAVFMLCRNPECNVHLGSGAV